MKFEHCLIFNLHKQGLVALVVMLLMICKGKRYCVSGSGMSNVDIGRVDNQIQVQNLLDENPKTTLLGVFLVVKKKVLLNRNCI